MTTASAKAAIAAPRGRETWGPFAPSFFPSLDLSSATSLVDAELRISRDFAVKARCAADIARRIAEENYEGRVELLRDLVRYLYWCHRYFLTLYRVHPCRWDDVPMNDLDARIVIARTDAHGVALAQLATDAIARLGPGSPSAGERRVFTLLQKPLACVTYDPGTLVSRLPALSQAIRRPDDTLLRVPSAQLTQPALSRAAALEATAEVPILTALLRQAGAIACEHLGRWGSPMPTPIGEIQADDYVLLAWPRTDAARTLLEEPARPRPSTPAMRAPVVSRDPATRLQFTPSGGVVVEALAAVKGEVCVGNDEIVANGAWHWSPMSPDDITKRTGVRQRRYTHRTLDELAVDAASQALYSRGSSAEPIGVIVACSATNAQPMPSLAARLAGALGLSELAGAFDVVAACAGFPYGLALAARMVEEMQCPALLVLAERFSDKLGTVRTSRMLFGDAAGALILAPACDGGDIEVVETYAGGSAAEVGAVAWPDAAFDQSVTVNGAGARSIVERYMARMVHDLRVLHGDDAMPQFDLIVPHQANELMIREIAATAGLDANSLYFDISTVGNLGAASIPVALADAILDGTIARPARVFAPAFAAGALAGYAVMTVDPRRLVGGAYASQVDVGPSRPRGR